MKKTINEYITLSQMERNKIKYLIVEGKSDPKIYSYIKNKDNIKIITPNKIDIPNKNYVGGCLSVIAIMEQIPDTSEKYFLGIIDKDLHPISIFRKNLKNNSLIILDCYSIESYFFNFLAFKKIIELVTDLSQEQVNHLFTEEAFEEFIKNKLVALYNLTLFILYSYISEYRHKKTQINRPFIKNGRKKILIKKDKTNAVAINKNYCCRDAKKFKLTYDCDDVTHIFLGANRHGMYENISNRNKVGYIRNFIQKRWKRRYNISNINDINYVIKNYTKGKWLLSYFCYATLEYIKFIHSQGCVTSRFSCGECDSSEPSNRSQCLYIKSKNKKYKDLMDALISNEAMYNSSGFQKIRDSIEKAFL